MKHRIVLLIAGILLFAVFSFFYSNKALSPENARQNPETEENTREDESIKTLAEGLEVPWALAFLPFDSAQGKILLTERKGTVRMIDQNGRLTEEPLLRLSEVASAGEGGLLGIAVHPEFEKNSFVYLYYTYQRDGETLFNRVVRFAFKDQRFTKPKTILNAIPGSLFHNGGRIKFGPDGFLYITTGDAQNPSLAQDKNSLAGKVLRITDEGKPVKGNPFDNEVYSFGHRNPQGLAWDQIGQLWATEHGPSALDEFNRIEKGKNYGWPLITGDQKQKDLSGPIAQSGQSTWAPSGLAYAKDVFFFAGLRSQTLFSATIKTDRVEMQEHLKRRFGRLREVVVGPDNFLYVTTSNRDGRGVPSEKDDQVIRINPTMFQKKALPGF